MMALQDDGIDVHDMVLCDDEEEQVEEDEEEHGDDGGQEDVDEQEEAHDLSDLNGGQEYVVVPICDRDA